MILLLNYFNSCDNNRNKELEFALRKNIESNLFREIVVLYEMNVFIPLEFCDKVREIQVEKRPTYKEMIFFLQKEYDNEICILSNTDIFFDRTLDLVNKVNFNKDVICLSRYEYDINNSFSYLRKKSESMFSQDSWIFHSNKKYNLEKANFTMGIPRCDGRIAFLFKCDGFNVINPCLSIKSFHCHASDVRNYICGIHFVEGEIETIEPSILEIN